MFTFEVISKFLNMFQIMELPLLNPVLYLREWNRLISLNVNRGLGDSEFSSYDKVGIGGIAYAPHCPVLHSPHLSQAVAAVCIDGIRGGRDSSLLGEAIAPVSLLSAFSSFTEPRPGDPCGCGGDGSFASFNVRLLPKVPHIVVGSGDSEFSSYSKVGVGGGAYTLHEA